MVKNRKSSSKTKSDSRKMKDATPESGKDELRDRIGELGQQEEQQELDEINMELMLAEKLKEQEGKYLRLAAEFDNYRKRTLREKAEMTKNAGADILYDLLPVIDDMDRAVEAMAGTEDIRAIRKGIELIYGKFRDFLAQKGVKEINAAGTEFNTDLHEAVTKIPAKSSKDKGKVVDVIQKGYQIDGKVIRYAKVVIGE
jgi:molecular chaperone GrpE